MKFQIYKAIVFGGLSMDELELFSDLTLIET